MMLATGTNDEVAEEALKKVIEVTSLAPPYVLSMSARLDDVTSFYWRVYCQHLKSEKVSVCVLGTRETKISNSQKPPWMRFFQLYLNIVILYESMPLLMATLSAIFLCSNNSYWVALYSTELMKQGDLD